MENLLDSTRKTDLLQRGFTRRSFGRIAALMTAGATLPFYNEFALAQRAASEGRPWYFDFPPDAVRININENPLGPCAEAAAAVHSLVERSGYYAFEKPFELAQAAAEVEGVKPSYVAAFAGSSDPLHRTVLAFCSPQKSFVMGDPGYEAGGTAAKFIGAKVIRVPLLKNYAHDVKTMVKADPNAGIIYICNPNNPSGIPTPKADIEWALANKPAGALLVLDEAYIHTSKAWEERGSDLVAQDKDVLILRTFSKLYGLAALRAGLAIARPDILSKMMGWGTSIMPVSGMVAAITSVKVKNLVQERRKIIADIREDTFAFLDKHNFSYIRSDTNFFMFDAKRPAKEFISAMAKEKVLVGRNWPAWPTHSRITVGSKSDMEKFKAALLKVMA